MSSDIIIPKGTSLADMLGKASGVGSPDSSSCVDVITFVEAPWGFGMGSGPGMPSLLPAQKWILKAFYGLELDNTVKSIPIYDRFCEELLYSFTEIEFRDYLYDEGRLNTKKLDGNHQMLALICGRRGTKTSVTSFIAGYEMYKMLSHRHPQRFFGILPDDIISMTCLSTTEDNATILYDRVAGALESSLFFRDHMQKEPNKTSLELKSNRDKEEFPENPKKHTIEFIADACSAKGLRGPSNIFIALDEVAHFFKDVSGKASSDKSDKAVYEAVKPSLAMFTYPGGQPAGKTILISSPAEKAGLLWDSHQRSFDPQAGEDILMVQLPSWEMNPTIPTKFLKSEYYSNPLGYDTEYGAQFSDRLSGWLDDESIVTRCIDENLRVQNRSLKRIPYFLGIDVGLKKDATALCVVHIENDSIEDGGMPVIVLDWYEEWHASKEKEAPVEGGLPSYDPEDVVKKIEDICGRFNIHEGLQDQYYHMSIMPLLKKKSLTQIRYREFNDRLNSDVYQNLMAKLVSKGVKIPSTGEYDAQRKPIHIPIVKELLKLQVIHKSKYIIKVFMPDTKDAHDDLSDAYARAVFLASEYLAKGGSVSSSGNTSKKRAVNANVSRVKAEARRAGLLTKRPIQGMIYKSGGNRYR